MGDWVRYIGIWPVMCVCHRSNAGRILHASTRACHGPMMRDGVHALQAACEWGISFFIGLAMGITAFLFDHGSECSTWL